MSGSDKRLSPVVSLAEKRRQEQNRLVQTLKPVEQRVGELEADQLRLIDLVLDQDSVIHDLNRRLDRIEERMLQLIGILSREA